MEETLSANVVLNILFEVARDNCLSSVGMSVLLMCFNPDLSPERFFLCSNHLSLAIGCISMPDKSIRIGMVLGQELQLMAS